MLYRRKPTVVEAVQWDGSNGHHIVDFCKSKVLWHFSQGVITVSTLHEGDINLKVGDYIVKGDKGEFYPCGKDEFESSFDEVPDNVK